MARVLRLIEYRGSKQLLETQLGNSLSDGTKHLHGSLNGISITVITLDSDVFTIKEGLVSVAESILYRNRKKGEEKP